MNHELSVNKATARCPGRVQDQIQPTAAVFFCLLDQRTFNCHWRTVETIAKYKSEGMKIEIFYFFPNGWLDRSLEALRNEKIALAWWGRPDWKRLRKMGSTARGELVADRFRKELGYKNALPGRFSRSRAAAGPCTSWFTRRTMMKLRN
jgi:three-Cys-motif partner protein